MTMKHWLAAATLCLSTSAFAQSSGRCPELPAGSGLVWETAAGDDFLFCKAMRADGHQAFSVMLRAESPFRERFKLREHEAVIDGHEVRWYRGDLAVQNALVRETLVELDDDLTAHIMVRVDDEQQLAESLRQAGGLRFSDTRMGSN
ncbi:hypothetical protein [Luteimonas kalidii]|uniref:Copper resistance protein CopZ n=1 Tax=Luteimonas kalidii TaxID=3042025 RepID=A0ABT6JS47_9GAMM|nr:hypothetical protein [Luteimonas kalidii]MDH5832966.1 hypothetical protein [Luteimonas kalidii]